MGYSNRAAALNKLGAAPDALKDLDECLKLDPTFVRAYARKGAAHALMKEYHKALKAYEEGLKIEPDNAECQQGKQSVMYSIQASQSNAPDQEQVAHAMADPEIQDILKDPQINIVLQKMQEDPSSINEFMKDQKIAEAINKLIAGGILKGRTLKYSAPPTHTVIRTRTVFPATSRGLPPPSRFSGVDRAAHYTTDFEVHHFASSS